ncbi:hypothetical protein GCM10027082_24750 [Comamonas humi]
MSGVNIPRTPSIPASVARKGAIPAVLLAALSSPLAFNTLEKLEGNVKQVYADHLAGGLPTFCAGRTDRSAAVGTKLTDDQCREVNKVTLLEYGYAVLGCVDWDHLNASRLIGLTMFAVNVGKAGACGSQAVQAINAGRIEEGCNLIARTSSGVPNWSSAGGVYVQGLQNRRQAERALCLAEPDAGTVAPAVVPEAVEPPAPKPDEIVVTGTAVMASPWWRRALDWLAFWR